jgi:uncharacterized protein (DUF3820 family)
MPFGKYKGNRICDLPTGYLREAYELLKELLAEEKIRCSE